LSKSGKATEGTDMIHYWAMIIKGVIST